MTTITAVQGSQPTLDGLKIGIIDAATHDGVSKALLLLRPETGDTKVRLTAGVPHPVQGFGALTLEEVIVGAEDGAKPRVVLRMDLAPGS
jgi:hypothetical protein